MNVPQDPKSSEALRSLGEGGAKEDRTDRAGSQQRASSQSQILRSRTSGTRRGTQGSRLSPRRDPAPESSAPVLAREARDSREFTDVVGHENQPGRQRVRRDQHVMRADRPAAALQPDAKRAI